MRPAVFGAVGDEFPVDCPPCYALPSCPRGDTWELEKLEQLHTTLVILGAPQSAAALQVYAENRSRLITALSRVPGCHHEAGRRTARLYLEISENVPSLLRQLVAMMIVKEIYK